MANAGNHAPLILALARQPPSALAMLAQEDGAFARQGLPITIREYESGKAALLAMLDGSADLATTGDIPVVFQGFTRSDFRILAQIAITASENSIVARRDCGIQTPADLRGRRIGTQSASAMHFFLHLFLLQNSLTEQDVTLHFLPPEELVPALVDGRVDAITAREPYSSEARQQLGWNLTVFDAPGLYQRSELLIARADIVANRPDALQSVLHALHAAAQKARHNEAEAIASVARRLGLTPDRVAPIWHGMHLAVTLDQALLSTLEDEASWALRLGLVPRTEIPDYLQLMAPEIIERVCPEGVTLIR